MHTIDLTDEQATRLRWLVLSALVQNQRIVRSREFAKYGPIESASIHDDIRLDSVLVALIPEPKRPERVTLPLRFAELGAI